MVKQADTRDLKSRASQEACRFKSGLQHHLTATRTLLRSDDHGFGTGQVFDPRFPKTGFFHPSAAIRARVVESSRGFNEHRETQQQPERILAAFVVNDPFEDQQDAVRGQGVIGFLEQRLFLLQIPIVQDMPHGKHVGGGQFIGKEISGDKFESIAESE